MRNQGLEADVECVGHVLDGYSDSELKDIDKQLRRANEHRPTNQAVPRRVEGLHTTGHGHPLNHTILRRINQTMKRTLTLFGAGLFGLATLAACGGGVDREGTKDNLVEQVEAVGGTVDEACVDEVFDKYDDDELKKFDDELSGDEPSAEATAFGEEIFACVSVEG